MHPRVAHLKNFPLRVKFSTTTYIKYKLYYNPADAATGETPPPPPENLRRRPYCGADPHSHSDSSPNSFQSTRAWPDLIEAGDLCRRVGDRMEAGRGRGGGRVTGVVRDRRSKADEATIEGGGGAGVVFEERRKRRHSDGEKAPVKLRKSRSDVSRSRATGGVKGRAGSGKATADAGDGEKKDEGEMEMVDVKEVDGNVVEGGQETLQIVPFVENVDSKEIDSIATEPANVEEGEEERLLLLPPTDKDPNWPNAEKKLQDSSFDEELTKLLSSKISLSFLFFVFFNFNEQALWFL